MKNFKFEDHFLPVGLGGAAMIPDVKEADAVVLIGGHETTASIGCAAYSLTKPVVALTAFHGTALDVWNAVLSRAYESYVDRRMITESDERALQDVTWEIPDTSTKEAEATNIHTNTKAAMDVLEVAKKLASASLRSARASGLVLCSTVGVVIVAIIGWLCVFFYGGKATASDVLQTWVFVMLYLAALIGTGLRDLVGLQRGDVDSISLPQLAMDIGISLVVAFGLALVYLIGGFSITGTFPAPALANDGKVNTFQTIAFGMSLLGLAAGYLQPLKQLQDRLEQAIAPKETPAKAKPND